MSDHARVADGIMSRIDDLAAAALASMYTNPFWDARFGDRGRQHALEDQRHHLEHLVYREGPAGALHAAEVALVERALTNVFERQRPMSSVMDDEARVRDDLSYHLSYLADALALGRPELFAAHVLWTDQFFVLLGKPLRLLRQEFLAIDTSLADHQDDNIVAARTVLRAGIDALAEVGP